MDTDEDKNKDTGKTDKEPVKGPAPGRKIKASSEFETQVIGLLRDMNTTVTGIDGRVKDLEKARGPKNATEETEIAIQGAEKEASPPDVDETIQEHRLSKQYAVIVKEVLGDQFEAWEEYEGVPPSHFRFVISIPPELSSIPKETHVKAGCDHKGERSETGEKVCKVPADLRSRTLSFAEGENGVREWCVKVRQNLNKFYTQNALQSPFSAE